MKVAIVYDSVYGNTRLLAETVASEAREAGHSVELFALREAVPREIEADVLFVGGPTHIKHMTRRVARFVRRLDAARWAHRPLVAFDTYGPLAATEEERRKQEPWIRPGAAGDIQAAARAKGLEVYPAALRVAVVDLRGPLVDGGLAEARSFTHSALVELATRLPTALLAPAATA